MYVDRPRRWPCTLPEVTGGAYHILHYLKSGTAPPPCGSKADPFDLVGLRDGLETPNIVAEVPAGARLCKRCEAATRKKNYVAAV